MRKGFIIVAPLLALTLHACTEFNVPNTNGPSIDALEQNPSVADVRIATIGLFIGLRSTANNYAGTAGILGREGYNLDSSEVRNVLGYLVGPLEPGGFGTDFGWSTEYRTQRSANIVLHALDALGSQMADAQKEGIRGVAETVKALSLLNVIRIRDDIGAAIDVDRDRSGELAPIVGKAAVYAEILRLLDKADVHLAAAGATFAFTMPSGFADFNTPTNFRKFNRAIRARTNTYLKNYTAVLTDLAGSSISTAAGDLQRGAFHTFSTAANDALNPQFDPTAIRWLAHPSILTDAQKRADGSNDLRAQNKTVRLAAPKALQGETSDVRFTHYSTNTTPMPIIKGEELVLMRSEARWFTGDKAGAIADLNVIRTISGGLPASTVTTASTDLQFIDALLYERRYSLVQEYGHRWVDMRRFDRLPQLPKTVPARDKIFPYVPLASDECGPRTPPPDGCRQVSGF